MLDKVEPRHSNDIYPGTYEGSGNPYDGPSGCTLDGQPLPCSFVMGFVNIGAAAQCPDNRCGPRHNGRRLGILGSGQGLAETWSTVATDYEKTKA
jgi:hypothetical protein